MKRSQFFHSYNPVTRPRFTGVNFRQIHPTAMGEVDYGNHIHDYSNHDPQWSFT